MTQPNKGGVLARMWRVGIYIRLSREDSPNGLPSESVGNQRAILHKHLAEVDDGDDYRLIREYVDDGISATTDDERGSFLEMLRDIQKGLINCVMVKDLARSFRNYSDQGYYLDDWFPRHNVRFISLFHQPLDSYREPRGIRSLAVPIQGMINENHCAETSDKVRAVFDIKRRRGEHIGSFAPFGYLKAPENNNALVVDPVAASVVQNIYRMFLQGTSKNAIVRHLNGQGVLCPAAYKREILGLKYSNPGMRPGRRLLWTATSVTAILKNRIYCGDMVQGRFRIKSYKLHIQERLPPDEWYIVENTHSPIVSSQVYRQVQALLARNIRQGPGQEEPYLFSGFLRCADCGKAMARSQVRERVYYFCRTYKDQSKEACTKHSIRHNQLEEAVLYALQQQLLLGVDWVAVLRRLERASTPQSTFDRQADALARQQQELAEIARYQQILWQDWKDGAVSSSNYQQIQSHYEDRTKALLNMIAQLEAEQVSAPSEQPLHPVLAEALQHQTISRLTRDLLIALVDSIHIREGGHILIRFCFAAPAP